MVAAGLERDGLRGSVGPADFDPAVFGFAGRFGVSGQREQQPRIAGRDIAAVSADPAPAAFAGEAGAGAVGVDESPAVGAGGLDQPQADPVAPRPALVQEDAGRSGVVGDDQVRIAVVVQVADRQAAADLDVDRPLPAFGRHGLETAAAETAEELVLHPQRVRVAGFDLGFDSPHRPVHDVEVEHAVAVDVEAGGAEAGHRPARVDQAGLAAAVVEQPVAVVQVERVVLADEVREEDVGRAVAVEVADRDAHAGLRASIAVEGGAREHRVLDEGAVALVEPQVVRHLVVGDVEVDETVAIEVVGGGAQGRAGFHRVGARPELTVASTKVPSPRFRRRRSAWAG